MTAHRIDRARRRHRILAEGLAAAVVVGAVQVDLDGGNAPLLSKNLGNGGEIIDVGRVHIGDDGNMVPGDAGQYFIDEMPGPAVLQPHGAQQPGRRFHDARHGGAGAGSKGDPVGDDAAEGGDVAIGFIFQSVAHRPRSAEHGILQLERAGHKDGPQIHHAPTSPHSASRSISEAQNTGPSMQAFMG